MVERGQSVIDSIARLESSRKPADLISARVYRELFLTEGKFLIRTLQGSGIDPNGPDQLNLNAVGFAASPDCNIDSLVSREHFFDQTERSEETRRLHRDMVARVVNSRSLPLETCMAVAPIAR